MTLSPGAEHPIYAAAYAPPKVIINIIISLKNLKLLLSAIYHKYKMDNYPNDNLDIFLKNPLITSDHLVENIHKIGKLIKIKKKKMWPPVTPAMMAVFYPTNW